MIFSLSRSPSSSPLLSFPFPIGPLPPSLVSSLSSHPLVPFFLPPFSYAIALYLGLITFFRRNVYGTVSSAVFLHPIHKKYNIISGCVNECVQQGRNGEKERLGKIIATIKIRCDVKIAERRRYACITCTCRTVVLNYSADRRGQSLFFARMPGPLMANGCVH